MARNVTKDFCKLIAYIEQYSVSELTRGKTYTDFLSQIHKKYYAYLTLLSEINTFVDNKRYDNVVLNAQFVFLQESSSDLCSSMFSFIHGEYKAAKLLLRSSIENFIKGFNMDELPDLDKEKSVYRIFDRTKELNFFSEDQNKNIFEKIHNEYSLLCADVHTATIKNMEKRTALNSLPTFCIPQAKHIVNSFHSLVSSYSTLLVFKYNEQFHKFNYQNKEIIENAIPAEFRKKLYNLE